MATLPKTDMNKNSLGYTRIALKRGQNVSNTQFPDYQTIDSLNSILTTGGYTEAQLNVMSRNDKVFAARKLHGLA